MGVQTFRATHFSPAPLCSTGEGICRHWADIPCVIHTSDKSVQIEVQLCCQLFRFKSTLALHTQIIKSNLTQHLPSTHGHRFFSHAKGKVGHTQLNNPKERETEQLPTSQRGQKDSVNTRLKLNDAASRSSQCSDWNRTSFSGCAAGKQLTNSSTSKVTGTEKTPHMCT